MTPAEAKAQIISQMDQYGMYLEETGNGILHTYQFYSLCKFHNILEQSDIDRFRKTLDSTLRRENNQPDGKIYYGLYNRSMQNSIQENSHDNYEPTTASVLIDNSFSDIPQQICAWSSKYWRFFDNLIPGKLGNFEVWFLGFTICCFKITNKEFPGVINIIWFYFTVLFNYLGEGANPQNTSEKLLNQIRFQICWSKWYMKPIYWYYLNRSETQYPNGLADIYKIYFGDTGLLTDLAQGVSFRAITEKQ